MRPMFFFDLQWSASWRYWERLAGALECEPSMRERVPVMALAVALRNRIIHGYDRVENAIVFDTVRRDLPGLVTALDAELSRFPLP